MTFLDFFLLALASWRLASLVVRERGPWDIFVWVRERAGIEHDKEKNPYIYPGTMIAELLRCIYCTSIWVGGFWLLFWLAAPLLATKIATVFALSTGAILIDQWLGN